MALQHTGIASTGTYRYIEFISVHTVHTVYTVHTVHIVHTELKTLEWWISGLMLNPLFFLISRLNIACSSLIFNLQINYPIRIKDIPF